MCISFSFKVLTLNQVAVNIAQVAPISASKFSPLLWPDLPTLDRFQSFGTILWTIFVIYHCRCHYLIDPGRRNFKIVYHIWIEVNGTAFHLTNVALTNLLISRSKAVVQSPLFP